MILIINDYDESNGGAGEIATSEKNLLQKREKTVLIIGRTKTEVNFFLVKLFIKNIKALIYSIISRKIIVHNYSLFPSILIISLYRKINFVIHDYALICPAKSFYNERLDEKCNILGYSSNCINENCGYSKKKKIYLKLIRPNYRKSKIRTLSKGSKKLFPIQNTDLLPNINTFESYKTQKSYKSIDVIFIGRYSYDKGFDRFVEIVKKNPDLVFACCGAGEITPLKLKNLTDFGWINNKKNIIHKITQSKLLLYPSRQLDADPIIVKQSLYNGVGVIIDHNNVARELVEKICGKNHVVENWSQVKLDQKTLSFTKTFLNEKLFSTEEELLNYYL